MHKGTGNRTKEDRIQLHLVFAPKWMINDMPVKDLIGFGVDTANDKDVTHARSEISREY